MILDNNNSNQNLNIEADSTNESNINQVQEQHTEISKLSEYNELIVSFQNGDWNKCNSLIASLLKLYPQDPELIRFKNDIETKLFLHDLRSEEEIKKKRTVRIRLILSSVIIFLILIAIGLSVFYSQALKNRQINLLNEQVQLENYKNMESQARQLIQGEKAEDALKIINQIKATYPAYPGIDSLYDEANTLVKLDSLYTHAMQAVEAKKYDEALSIFKQIDAIRPYYRDVKKQEAFIENQGKITDLLISAQKDFTDGKWEDVINLYDQVYIIDPSAFTPDVKEHLLYSYLKTIINLLNNKDATVEEVNKAETYYRKALALFPQSKQFAEERANLQKLSRDLLVFRYSQMGKQIVNDPNPTVDSINLAVTYLTNASNLNPDSTQLKSDIDKVQLFMVGLQHFNDMDWGSAIDDLTKLSAQDSNYGNGKVKQLLFEAESGRASQYISMNIYLDARVHFEAAENIAFGQTANKLQLYQVQINLGNTLGKLHNYKDAASYYKYALNSINIYSRLTDHPDFNKSLKAAEANFSQEQYQESFNLYETTLKNMAAADVPYSYKDFDAQPGSTLVLIAIANSSTLQAIQEHNQLPNNMVININKKISIPYIQ